MPFLVSDPYPTSVTQPVKFVVTIDGGAPVDSAPLVGPNGEKSLHFDVGAINPGTHHITVKAANQYGVSVSVPFDFVNDIPEPPQNLQILF